MEVLVKILQFLLSIAILVLLHEFGHFAFAKLFKVRVEKFYLFFNPWFSLFKYKKGETEYGIGWLPLGGYVKIAGMIDESMDKEQMKLPPKPDEYRSRPPWQRFFIITGGVLVNFLLALFIYSIVLFTWGQEYLPTKNLTYGIVCEPIALEMGFEHGDKILLVDGKEIEDFQQVVPTILLERAKTVTVERSGQIKEIQIDQEFVPRLLKSSRLFSLRFPLTIGFVADDSPAQMAGFEVGDKLVAINGVEAQYFDQFVEAVRSNINHNVTFTFQRDSRILDFEVTIPEEGVVGISHSSLNDFFDIKQLNYSILQSIPAGIKLGVNTLTGYLKQLRLVITPSTKAYESLGGFITIGSIFPGTWDWQSFWMLTALISIILAIMNILPIPALDGGHMVFILYEMVSGRKPSDKFMEYAQIAGMILILSLLIFANANDIVRQFNK
jgi:regulator of sigma E protease